MVKTLNKPFPIELLNKDKIYVDPISENKMEWLKRALNENKVFILTKTAMKRNIGIKCDNDIITQMYIFREEAIAYAEKNGIKIEVNEKYSDDSFYYDAQLIIRKKGC